MRRFIGLVALCLVAAGAQAQSYHGGRSAQESNDRVQVCSIIGRSAQRSYVMVRDTQKPREPDSRLAPSPWWAMYQWAVEYGNKASSEHDAYSTAAAKCLDNFERMAFSFQRGKQLDVSELK